MDLAELAAFLETQLEKELKVSRVRHSRAVALLASELCLRNGLSPEKGRVAGLGHDLCKEMSLARQKSLASSYAAYTGRSFESEGPIGEAALHGPAAAGLLLLEYGWQDEELLDAIAFHTLGGSEMSDLARLIYAADKLEPGRLHIERDFRDACLELAPTALFEAVLAKSLAWLRAEGLPIAPSSLALLDQVTQREVRA